MKRNFSLFTKGVGVALFFCLVMFSVQANAQSRKHTVKAGETLYHIATEYGLKVADLQKANPSVGTSLKVGQELVIPEGGKSAAADAPETVKKAPEPAVKKEKAPVATKTVETTTKTTTTAEEPVPTRGYHTVKAKETLTSIAKDFGVTEADLKKWNDLSKGIKPGMSLKVVEL